MISEDARAEILHEHYNRTCESIQTHIGRRERLLLAVLLLTVVMLFQMAVPGDATQQLADLAGRKLGLTKPCDVGFLDSVVWFGMLCLVMRYCQTGGYIERQYGYIHALEERLNEAIGKEDITREGKAYLANYPRFSGWTHFVYTTGLPLLLGAILVWRWRSQLRHDTFCLKTGFDSLVFLACLVSILLYMRQIHRRR